MSVALRIRALRWSVIRASRRRPKLGRRAGFDLRRSGYEAEPLGLSVAQAAKVLGVQVSELNDVCYGKIGISPEMAIRLAKAFGGTAEEWRAFQTAYDLAQARQKEQQPVSNLTNSRKM